uniref:Prefoldin subunit 1 n=1 Tax=Cyprinus carpio carpio TaxID=630221 RepID=A0A8C1BMB8_CYPCA
MAAPVDLELKKAFAELQAKMVDTQQKVKLADLQIEQLSRMKKHANLTHAEIKSLPDSTRMYEGAGRMFILQSKDEIANQLSEKQKTADEKIKDLELSIMGRYGQADINCCRISYHACSENIFLLLTACRLITKQMSWCEKPIKLRPLIKNKQTCW